LATPMHAAPMHASAGPRGPVEIRIETEETFRVRGSYEWVFNEAMRAIVNCGGKVYQQSLSEGRVVGKWGYGLTIMGMRANIDISDAGHGWLKVTGIGYMVESVTGSAAPKKAREVITNLRQLIVNAPPQAAAQPSSMSAPQVNPPSDFGGNSLAYASVLCGTIGLFCMGIILGPMAVVYGGWALAKGGSKGQALLGIGLGIFAVLVGAAVAMLLISAGRS
jgi:hypothetical protein